MKYRLGIENALGLIWIAIPILGSDRVGSDIVDDL